MKRIILCADDYGQNSAISQAIIELIELKRLSAVSCMADVPAWPQHAIGLKKFKDQVDIGLHINLTFGGAKRSLKTILLQSYLHFLNKKQIESDINAQLDLFLDAIGAPPDFIDGHQHVHQLPGVRDVFFKAYQARFKDISPYVRSTYNKSKVFFPQPGFFKQWVIQCCGAAKFERSLARHSIPHNTSFSGAYSFAQAHHYARYFDLFLSQISDCGLIMCHPGLPGGVPDDIPKARPHEYAFLKSDLFLQCCWQHEVSIVKHQYLLPPY